MAPSAEKILADALPHGIVVLDQAGNLCWFNQVAHEYLRLDHIQNADFLRTIKPENVFNEVELYAPNNKNRRLAVSARPYLEDQCIFIIQDITHQYRLERMRQDFIANVSHELRTPLTVFRGYLELLMDHPEIDNEQRQQMLQQMVEQDQRMEHLVKDLLLLARLESHEPDRAKHEVVNVAELIEDIYRGVHSLAKEHHFEFDLDQTLLLNGEPHELRSAFTNIMVNAIRYTPEGGNVTVRWYQDQSGKHFSVTDTGVGIAKPHLDRVTQRFYRVDKARSREQGGTGLGLAIVKHVLLRHGGELSIESEPERGSTFCCCFR